MYGLLGINTTATDKEIKKAFRKKALQHHPDKGGDEEIFKKLYRAYETLIDPIQRRDYDAEGEEDVPIDPRDIAGRLDVGTLLSDKYRLMFKLWYREFNTIRFISNYNLNLSFEMERQIPQEREEGKYSIEEDIHEILHQIVGDEIWDWKPSKLLNMEVWKNPHWKKISHISDKLTEISPTLDYKWPEELHPHMREIKISTELKEEPSLFYDLSTKQTPPNRIFFDLLCVMCRSFSLRKKMCCRCMDYCCKNCAECIDNDYFCAPCANIIRHRKIEILIMEAERAITQKNSKEALSYVNAAAKKDGHKVYRNSWKRLVQLSVENNVPKLAIRCLDIVEGSDDEWFNLAKKLCKKNMYSYTYTCLVRMKIKPTNTGQDRVLASLCLKMHSIESLFKLASKSTGKARELYLSSIGGKAKWDKIACDYLEKDIEITMFSLMKGDCNKESWIEILRILHVSSKFSLAMKFTEKMIERFPDIRDKDVPEDFRLYLWSIRKVHSKWESLINKILERGDVKSAVIGIAIMGNRITLNPTFPVLRRVIKDSGTTNWFFFGKSLLRSRSNSILALSCLSLSGIEWKKIGDTLLKEGEVLSALDAYMQNSSNIGIVVSRGIDIANNRNVQAMRYLIAAYRYGTRLSDVLIHLCRVFVSQGRTVKQLLEKSLSFEGKDIYRYMLIDGSDDITYSLELLGKMRKKDNSYFKIVERLQNQLQQELNGALYTMDPRVVTNVLLKVTPEMSGCIKSFRLSKHENPAYKSLMELFLSTICRIEGRTNEELEHLIEAIMISPSKQMYEAICTIIEKNHTNLSSHVFIPENLNDPQPEEYHKMLRSNELIRLVRSYEKGISQSVDEGIERAFAYIDLCTAAGHPAVTCNNIILASLIILRVAEKSTDSAEVYACKNLICDLVGTVRYLGMSYLNPFTRLHMYRLILSISRDVHTIFERHVKSKAQNYRYHKEEVILRDTDKEVLEDTFERIKRLTSLFPLTGFKPLKSLNMIYFDVVGRETVSTFLERSLKTKLLKEHIIHYHILEGVWQGWHDGSLERSTEKSMEAFLRDKSYKRIHKDLPTSMKEVEDFLSWPVLPRDPDGYITEGLYLRGKIFTSVDGIEFDIERATVRILLSSGPGGLFSLSDVEDVMRQGIVSSFFTLDQPDVNFHCHPFQLARYAPSNIKGTDYLGTLTFADYILKMFTSGQEISSKLPFKRRDISHILERVPDELRREITRLIDRESGSSRAHRFWIEPCTVHYKTEERDGKMCYTLYPNVKMRLKKHLLRLNERGELVDDLDDKDDSEEAKYAEMFTKRYNEIGEHFPVFLRLRELIKMQAICAFSRNIYEGVNRRMSQSFVNREKLNEVLNEMRNSLNYPVCTDSNIEDTLTNTLIQNNLSKYQVAYYELERVRGNIRSQLEQVDTQIRDQIVKSLVESHKLSHNCDYELRNSIHSWLIYGNSSFGDTIVEDIDRRERNKLRRFCDTLKGTGLNIDEMKVDEGYYWVPAVMTRRENSRVYGGVNMSLNISNGGGGSAGGSASGSSPLRARYIVSMNADGKVWEKATCVNALNGSTMNYSEGYRSTNPQNSTQAYWKPNHGSVNHITLHKSGIFNIHGPQGKTAY